MMQLLTAVIPQLGRLAREDGGRQKIMQYDAVTDRWTLHFSRLPACAFIPTSGIVSHRVAGNYRHDRAAGNSAGRRPRMGVSSRDGDFADDGHACF